MGCFKALLNNQRSGNPLSHVRPTDLLVLCHTAYSNVSCTRELVLGYCSSISVVGVSVRLVFFVKVLRTLSTLFQLALIGFGLW